MWDSISYSFIGVMCIESFFLSIILMDTQLNQLTLYTIQV